MKIFILFLFANFSLIASELAPLDNTQLDGIPHSAEYNHKPTPLFSSKQVYLGASPVGIGTDIAWKLRGGKGENVKIIDIEPGLNEKHEDLPKLFYSNNPISTEHGNAVMGILGARDNGFGITGIAHKAKFGLAGFIEEKNEVMYLNGVVKQIQKARELLSPGDVFVILTYIEGPNGFFIMSEYWPDIFKELKAATDKGIHCVQAAANGGTNLDNWQYRGLFDRKVRDSGCIIVGSARVVDKARIIYSNYGSIVDAFAYGESVVTTGYGDLFNGGPNSLYTQSFEGTSSATPIVAGAVALVSSIALQQKKLITPKEMREAIRITGIEQGGYKTENIGKFPNIGAMLKYFNLKLK